jgi:alginate O-acetyltransferase complex protein AlgI
VSPWTRLVLLTTAVYVLCKALMFRPSLGYLLLWPGMDPAPFGERRTSDGLRLAAWGLAKMAVGMALLAWAPHPLVVLVGIGLLVHFGLCDVLCGLWRRAGVPVERLFVNPAASRTLGEFWGRRWNLAFHAVAKRWVFLPVARRWGTSAALAATFLASGLIHDLLLSVPAGGGYGFPTLYFTIQGLGVWLERRYGWVSRIWALGVVILPAPLLFHPPFIEALIRPLTS